MNDPDRPRLRILFAAGDPYLPEAIGGCGVNTHALCRLLRAASVEVAVLAGRLRTGSRRRGMARDDALGYPVWRSAAPLSDLAAVCRSFAPDVAIIQSCGDLVPMCWQCLWLGIPSLVYLHNTDFDYLGGDCLADPSIDYLVPSHFVAERVLDRWGLASHVVSPAIVATDYQVTSTHESVVFVNPRPHKGLDIALSLAAGRPDIPFDFVESWPLDGRAMAGLVALTKDHRNIRLHRATMDMTAFYRRARIVLVPSRCDEAWGRIVTEAQVSAIPALTSSAGGLPEAVGDAGLLVAPDAPASAWSAALARLWDDQATYRRCADAAGSRAAGAALQPANIVAALLEHVRALCQRAAASRAGSPPAIAGGTIWYDMTTTARLAGLRPVGITRVETSYAACFLRQLPQRVRFCEIFRKSGYFRPLSHEAARRLVDGIRRSASRDPPIAPPARPRSWPRRWARNAERDFRLWRRRVKWAVFDRIPAVYRLYGLATFRPGDVLLLPGNVWSWHDLDRLRRIRRETGVRLVVICHDVIPAKFPEFFVAGAAADFERFLGFLLAEASLILCVSAATLQDLRDYAASRRQALPPARVLPLGHELRRPSAEPALPELRGLTPGGFVLSVGTLQVRKNQALLYQLWRRLAESGRRDVPILVLTGSIGWLIDDLVGKIRGDPLVRQSIMIVETASDADLAWLYANCRFTLYPSLYEGFGLPIAESLAYGRHCVASSTSAMTEAGQGLAHHLDPRDLDAWYAEVGRLLDDPARLRDLEARIRAEYRPLGWEQSFRLLVEAIAGLEDGGGGRAAPWG